MKPHALFLTAMIFLLGFSVMAQEGSPRTALMKQEASGPESITILWSSGNPDVFDNIIWPYFHYSCEQRCWKDMTLFVWGNAVRQIAEHEAWQDKLALLISKGLKVKACRLSSEQCHATDLLKTMGVELGYIEQELTRELKGRTAQLLTL